MLDGGRGILGGGSPDAAALAKFLFSVSSLTPPQDILKVLKGEKSLAILAPLGWDSAVGDWDVNGE